MKHLNKTYRNKDVTTDVISFPFEPEEFEQAENFLGDIVISSEQAARQARENGTKLDQEICQIILHGALHLAGYDHEIDRGPNE